MKRLLPVIGVVLVLSCFLAAPASAQFKEEAFSQKYNSDIANQKDSVEALFSFKEYFGALAHKNEMKIGTSFAGSIVFIGGQQIYNKDYWKLPIVYGTTLGALGTGLVLNHKGNSNAAKYCFIGAGVAYWATLMDGVVCYEPSPYPHPGTATLMSILCPGLGQAYNHEYWKIPVYVGGLGAALHFYDLFKTQFDRYRRIYIEATNPDVPYSGPITAEQALYYRNIYRSYKDYSLVAVALVYLLQVIDANVFAFMHDFEVVDDLAFDFSPTLIMPENQYAFSANQSPAIGMRFGISF